MNSLLTQCNTHIHTTKHTSIRTSIIHLMIKHHSYTELSGLNCFLFLFCPVPTFFPPPPPYVLYICFTHMASSDLSISLSFSLSPSRPLFCNSYLTCFFYAEKSLLMIAELPFPETIFGQFFQMGNYFFGSLFLSTILGQVEHLFPVVACKHL